MEITLREAKINDSESIAKLSNQLGYPSLRLDIEKRFQHILQNPDHCVYVAIENENVVGWIHGLYSLRVESDPFVEIGGLVVCENSRQKGIGKRLVERIMLWSTEKGCAKVRVRCNVIRTESHQFYKKIGFHLNKEQKVFDRKID